jgi:hypothetical protein
MHPNQRIISKEYCLVAGFGEKSEPKNGLDDRRSRKVKFEGAAQD